MKLYDSTNCIYCVNDSFVCNLSRKLIDNIGRLIINVDDQVHDNGNDNFSNIYTKMWRRKNDAHLYFQLINWRIGSDELTGHLIITECMTFEYFDCYFFLSRCHKLNAIQYWNQWNEQKKLPFWAICLISLIWCIFFGNCGFCFGFYCEMYFLPYWNIQSTEDKIDDSFIEASFVRSIIVCFPRIIVPSTCMASTPIEKCLHSKLYEAKYMEQFFCRTPFSMCQWHSKKITNMCNANKNYLSIVANRRM